MSEVNEIHVIIMSPAWSLSSSNTCKRAKHCWKYKCKKHFIFTAKPVSSGLTMRGAFTPIFHLYYLYPCWCWNTIQSVQQVKGLSTIIFFPLFSRSFLETISSCSNESVPLQQTGMPKPLCLLLHLHTIPNPLFLKQRSSKSTQFLNKLSLEKPQDGNNADTYQQPGSFKKEK